MVEISAERGLGDATVACVVARAGVSRRTFYELFEDREACFLAALEDAVGRIAVVVEAAFEQPGPWRSRIRAALTVLLECFDYDGGAGRLLIVEVLGAGPSALERRKAVLAQMVLAVDEGRREGKYRESPPPLTAEGVVGAVFSIVHARMLDEPSAPLVELAGALTGVIVLPYLGPIAVREELERPVPPKSHLVSKREVGDPLRDLGMRLTHRTIRVLLYVAAAPGSSNREVGVASGIADQGQISKLLGRLERLGLLHNTGLAPGRGAPNAWRLTTRGAEVKRAVSDTGPRGGL